ncbi:hypothetical protein ABAC460_04170 [Asticcacaulis sp. AC460]|nr:hypothetical protein ABAC460_04170 [Asticcacaulis sp. AC460]
MCCNRFTCIQFDIGEESLVSRLQSAFDKVLKAYQMIHRKSLP